MEPPPPPCTTPFKKRLLHRVQIAHRQPPPPPLTEEKEDEAFTEKRSESLDLDHNDPDIKKVDDWSPHRIDKGPGSRFGVAFKVESEERLVQRDECVTERNEKYHGDRFGSECVKNSEENLVEKDECTTERTEKFHGDRFGGECTKNGEDRDAVEDDRGIRRIEMNCGDSVDGNYMMEGDKMEVEDDRVIMEKSSEQSFAGEHSIVNYERKFDGDDWERMRIEEGSEDRAEDEYIIEGEKRTVEGGDWARQGGDEYIMRSENWKVEGGDWLSPEVGEDCGDRFRYMMDSVQDKEDTEELSERYACEERIAELEKLKKERHDVVRERQKKKELEVFVGGLDWDTNEEDLRQFFCEVGDVTEVRLLMNPMTGKNKGFAFIRFATVEQSKRALNELKHPVINGKQCGVAPSQDNDTLFVGNICKEWTKEMLREKLLYYGIDKFEELTLVEDAKIVGLNRGFAFLDFPSRADALDACRRLQRRDVVFGTDRTARVAFADTFIEPDDEVMSQVKTVFIDGLSPTWDEDMIKDNLRKFGRIEKVELAQNMPAAKRDDFGFVTFDTHDAAVSCVDGINDSELVIGSKKVKVRARLSRPRQRGKPAKRARGGYVLGSDGYGSSRDSGVSHMDSNRFTDRYRRSFRSRSPYDASPRRPLDSRDRRLFEESAANRTGSRKQYVSAERSSKRRSPVYIRNSLRTDYTRREDSFTRQRDFARVSSERQSCRGFYDSRGSGYSEDSSRRVSRKTNSPYDNDDEYIYLEQSSRYHDSSARSYRSMYSLKRPYSTMEESHSSYTESSRRQPRAGFDYGSRSDFFYDDRVYESNPTRSGRGLRSGYNSLYDRNTSYIGRRGEISSKDAELMQTRYDRDHESRDYISSRSLLRAGSYSPE